MNSSVINKTRNAFSFAWSKFAKNEVERQWYKDSFSYLKYIPQDIFKGEAKLGLDVGCGSGSDMIYISQYGATIVGIDISDAIKVTRENTVNFDRLYLAQANIYNLPFKDRIFDFVYSFGVLHHLPEPEKGFRILCSKVKKGGIVIIYVYEDFSERTSLERTLLKMVNSFRVVTAKVSPSVLYLFLVILAPFVFLFCSMPYQILRMIPKAKVFAERIPFRHTTRLDCIVSDLYDRFSPPIENRYRRKEVEEWFNKSNLEDVHIINYRGWVAWGRKK